MTAAVYDRLCEAARAEGCLLFTISRCDHSAATFARVHTSHPVDYPLSGLKPITRDAWYDHVILGRHSFVANTPAEFETLFPDHALITALGLGACMNIPVIAQEDGLVLGCVNILAEAQHFSPQKVDAYHALVTAERDPLLQALRAD